MQRLFQGLNDAQRDAVSTDSGPLLVLAGAGTGKTRVVTVRMARLVALGVPADRILAVTFTNKAADEMLERVGQLLGSRQATRPEVSTFHSYCVRVLRRQAKAAGLSPRFAIYSTGPQRSLIQRVMKEARLPGTSLRPDDALQRISRWKSRGLAPEQAAAVAATDSDHLASLVYRRYEQALKGLNAVDFDDLLLVTQRLFAREPEVLRAEAQRFDHVLIDEYQDTNDSQYRIAKGLTTGHRNLCVVGDDDQSIYSWRGAEVAHILGFRKDWPDAKVVRLEENYRSTAPILEFANRLILRNQHRHPKTLRTAVTQGRAPRIWVLPDEEAESRQVVNDIARRLREKACRPKDIAILFRTNEQPKAFEQELRRQKVPYLLVGGTSFFDRREVQDILAYLRLLDDPQDDQAWLRVCNRPARGISPATSGVLRAAAVAAGSSIWTLVGPARQAGPALPEAAQRAVAAFVDLIHRFHQRIQHGHIAESMRDLIQQINYRHEIDTNHAEADERIKRWESVQEVLYDLERAERRAAKFVLGHYLHELVLRASDFGTSKDETMAKDQVRLMTLHAAKGLEFPLVYLVGLEEGLLPHRKSVNLQEAAIEEERRLCYVGVTRAREELILTLAKARERRGKAHPTHPSRFLYELTGKTDHPDYQRAIQAAWKGSAKEKWSSTG